MTSEERFTLVRHSILLYCKEIISDNWNNQFDMWLQYEADHEFGHGYQKRFKEYFSDCMNSSIEDKLYFAGNNLLFAINAYMSCKDDAELEDILELTEKFISEQMDYLETDDLFLEDDFNGEEINEDNPS